MTILNSLMLAMFFASMAVQYNDPDPLLWMLLYGFAALNCLLFLRQIRRWQAPAALALIAATWSTKVVTELYKLDDPISWTVVFSGIAMQDKSVELLRELGGLLIVLSWMLVLAALAYRSQQAKAAAGSTVN